MEQGRMIRWVHCDPSTLRQARAEFIEVLRAQDDPLTGQS